jgi:hypothetical protein
MWRRIVNDGAIGIQTVGEVLPEVICMFSGMLPWAE